MALSFQDLLDAVHNATLRQRVFGESPLRPHSMKWGCLRPGEIVEIAERPAPIVSTRSQSLANLSAVVRGFGPLYSVEAEQNAARLYHDRTLLMTVWLDDEDLLTKAVEVLRGRERWLSKNQVIAREDGMPPESRGLVCIHGTNVSANLITVAIDRIDLDGQMFDAAWLPKDYVPFCTGWRNTGCISSQGKIGWTRPAEPYPPERAAAYLAAYLAAARPAAPAAAARPARPAAAAKPYPAVPGITARRKPGFV